jgi:hypothetical protein
MNVANIEVDFIFMLSLHTPEPRTVQYNKGIVNILPITLLYLGYRDNLNIVKRKLHLPALKFTPSKSSTMRHMLETVTADDLHIYNNER